MSRRVPFCTRQGGVVTAWVGEDVQSAIERFLDAHRADLDAALSPFDLTADDIGMPDFERFVSLEEVRNLPYKAVA